MVEAHAQRRRDLVVGPRVSQVRGRRRTVEAAVGRCDPHSLVAGRVPLVDPVDVTGVQYQAIDVRGRQCRTAKRLRQQPGRAGKSKRQEDRDIAAFHHGLAPAHFRGEGQARVIVCRFAIGFRYRQQLGTAA
ncbi:hypothetical protein D3C78_961850 [compost metagenome]